MKKCFDNVVKLDINESLGNSIVGMISAEGEEISFGSHSVNTKYFYLNNNYNNNNAKERKWSFG